MNESEIFNAVVKLSEAEREKLLDALCKEQPELRGQVEALIEAHFDSATFLHESVDKPTDRRIAETVSQPPPTENPGTIIAGRYKLLQEIGEGGMGSVWLAEQAAPVKRKVAIKLIKAGMDSKSVLARFDAERQALALMDHPNIAKVYDGGVTELGRPYFVMEYVKGIPLTEYCDQARLSLAERLKLFASVCQAVQHAHQKGIIHRDLKPSNILACLYDGQPVPKVIDFGLAKAMYRSLTEQSLFTAHGMMLGTPLYMSPEQAEHNNLDVDTRTDIYSLGVILYEMLTGSTPLEKQQLKDAAVNEILRLIKEVEPQKPSTRLSGSTSLPSIAAQRSIEPKQLSKSLAGDLDWIVMKALDKERSRRYETANGFARDIDRFLNDEAVEACPPSATYRLKKLLRRNKVSVAMTLTLAVAMIVGLAGTTWQMFRAMHAEQIASERFDELIAARNREEQSRRLAERQRDLSEERFQLALDQLNGFVTMIRTNFDLQSRFPALKKNLIGQTAPFYKKLIEAMPNREDLRISHIKAMTQLGIMHCSIGEHEAAVANYRRVLESIEHLRDDTWAPTDGDVSMTKSVVYLNATAEIFSPEIQDAYEQALRTLRRQGKQLADDSEFSTLLHDGMIAYAHWSGGHGNSKQAAEFLLYAIEIGPENEFTEYLYKRVASSLLENGQVDRYFDLCHEMQNRFGPDSFWLPEVAQFHKKAPVDWDTISRVSEERSTDEEIKGLLRSVSAINKGIAEYRRGRFAEAIVWLTKYKDRISGDFNSVRAHLFLAMAQAQAGEPDPAALSLQRADEIMAKNEARTLKKKGLNERWDNPIQFRILRLEANKALDVARSNQ